MPDQIVTRIEDPLSGSTDAFTLDNAAWFSLNGPHARLAELHGQAARYPIEVAPFAALSPDTDARAWDDLASLVGPGTVVALSNAPVPPPEAWDVVRQGQGVQMIATSLRTADDGDVIHLGAADVDDMLDLVERTKPGPFLPRTVELGNYLGIRDNGTLVAMAGERLHPPGWTEISAVCTDSAYRGRGLGTRLVRAVAAGVRSRGETPFLHAAAANSNAIRLYVALGFTIRRHTTFQRLRAPDSERSSR